MDFKIEISVGIKVPFHQNFLVHPFFIHFHGLSCLYIAVADSYLLLVASENG